MESKQDNIEATGGPGEGPAADPDAADAAAPILPDIADGAGPALRARRDARRLSLEHIAAETRIPIRHLEVIEEGDFGSLPSRTYAIGFARSYARAVGLDESEVADQIRAEMGDAGPRYSSLNAEMEPGDPAKQPSASLAWFGGFAALILLIGIIAFASTFFGAGEGPASLIAQSDPAEDADAAVAAAGADNAAAAAPAISSDGQVIFTALEDGVWVRFYEASGERLFEAQMSSGETFTLPKSASEPRINTGRPDAFSITIDGRDVPKLSEEPVTMGDTPISAAALLARAETTGAPGATN
ncbi:MAG: RodZ domain-containing protein [Pseudomonadota bacterium]